MVEETSKKLENKLKLTEDESNENKPLSDEEKLELSEDINCLTGPHLGKIASIIKTREPQQGDSEEFEIDFDKLKPSTVRELAKYVNSVLRK
ncbi:hypothetical protein WDU94_010518 [Cyamophila willieti]